MANDNRGGEQKDIHERASDLLQRLSAGEQQKAMSTLRGISGDETTILIDTVFRPGSPLTRSNRDFLIELGMSHSGGRDTNYDEKLCRKVFSLLDPSQLPVEESTVAAAAAFGLTDEVHRLHAQRPTLDLTSALYAAAKSGHGETAAALLARGAQMARVSEVYRKEIDSDPVAQRTLAEISRPQQVETLVADEKDEEPIVGMSMMQRTRTR